METVPSNNHWVSNVTIHTNSGIEVPKNEMDVMSLHLVKMIC